ncbi:chromosome partitioning protein ParB [Erythrobacter sp. QSSC1-22B]|uniref:ParB/RepB/Spo0J family partition protein n=1 Tax=Erythrobacter sp. QSSC1-22B TaxID=1860125 RepID=UPI000805F89E|nr:ParB/RepB/Spo0J family partition protein [Erythrobacter sp. QSSC1-22B]OBX19989.1 chromosome partitioning protein ParB [Erythrobacter sp. QSSC1-22B]
MSDGSEATNKGAARKRKLGRGLGALMGEVQREEPLVRRETAGGSNDAPQQSSGGSDDNGLRNLPIASISPLPGQPRTHFDDAALGELAASIAARGVIQPIIVRPKGDGSYQLVAGERRWRAAQKARLHDIPAIVRTLDDREVMALALIENLQREDLNPVEEARAYHRLSEEEEMTQADIAEMVDKSRSHVANMQRLLALPDEILGLLADSALSMGHARALIGHDDAVALARRAVKEKLSVREVERLARHSDEPKPIPTKGTSRVSGGPSTDADIVAVQNHLEEFLGMPVRITSESDTSKGAVSIRYRSLDQLDLLCQRLTGGEI